VTLRAVVVALLAVHIATASASPRSDARRHIERATSAHKAGNFSEALDELTQAYALDPQPGLLFAIGQVQVKLGNCPAAVTSYRRFLATHPAADDADIVDQAIKSCETAQAEPRLALATPDFEPDKAPPAVDTPTTPPTDRPHRMWITGALFGTGAAFGIAAVLSYRGALEERNRADSSPDYQSYADHIAAAQDQRSVAIVLGAAGGVLIGASVAHYLLGREPAHQVSLAPTAGGGVITLSGGF
jgi:hypothetical protein